MNTRSQRRRTTTGACRVLALGAAIVGLVGFGARAAEPLQFTERTRVFLQPAELWLAPGERALVEVRVEGLRRDGLAAMQVELLYDPAAVDLRDPNARFVPSGVPAFAPLGGSPLCAVIRGQASCPDPEWMLTRSGRQAVGTSRDDLEPGRLIIAYGTRGAPDPPTGSGTLALVEVVGRQAGPVRLRLDRTILADGQDPPRRLPHDSGPRSPGRERLR